MVRARSVGYPDLNWDIPIRNSSSEAKPLFRDLVSLRHSA
jgi:hypothetical protein